LTGREERERELSQRAETGFKTGGKGVIFVSLPREKERGHSRDGGNMPSRWGEWGGRQLMPSSHGWPLRLGFWAAHWVTAGTREGGERRIQRKMNNKKENDIAAGNRSGGETGEQRAAMTIGQVKKIQTRPEEKKICRKEGGTPHPTHCPPSKRK